MLAATQKQLTYTLLCMHHKFKRCTGGQHPPSKPARTTLPPQQSTREARPSWRRLPGGNQKECSPVDTHGLQTNIHQCRHSSHNTAHLSTALPPSSPQLLLTAADQHTLLLPSHPAILSAQQVSRSLRQPQQSKRQPPTPASPLIQPAR